jgi:hypothetical protein
MTLTDEEVYNLRIKNEKEGNAVAEKLEQMGLPQEKSWRASPDEKTCPICRGNQDAGWIPLHDPFPSGHQMAPAHMKCRCRTLKRRKPGQDPGPHPNDRWLVTLEGDTIVIKPNTNWKLE